MAAVMMVVFRLCFQLVVVERRMERALLELAAAQPEEDDWGDDQDVQQAGNHAADDGRGEGLHDFRALAVAPHDG